MPEPADPAMPLMPFTNYQQEECLARGEADSSSLALPLSFKLQKKRRQGCQETGFQCLACHNSGETLD